MKRMTSLAALCGLSAALLAGPAWAEQHMPSHFRDAERWAKTFDDPRRDETQKPAKVIEALGLPPDAVVADVGAGTGYFTSRLARALPRGRVYAVDIEADMVRYLGERARQEGLGNVVALKGEPGDARLPAKVDLIVMVNVFHHIDDRVAYFRKLRASLKPGGRLAIIDHRMDVGQGPPRAMRIPPAQVKAQLEAAGYGLARQHDFLPEQYFLVFRAAGPR